MSARVSIDDLGRLLRDEHPLVRAAGQRELGARLSQDDLNQLGATLWELAATDAHEALPWVVPQLAHPNERLARLALLALRGLHPLCALQAQGSAAHHGHGSLMGEWLAPRFGFEQALRATLRRDRERVGRVTQRLAELPGEQQLLERVVQDECSAEVLANYRATRARHATDRHPVQLILALTYRCNRKCPYCYAYESQDFYDGDVELEDAKSALDWAVRQGARLISFTGGEPTCHPRFAELVHEVKVRGLRLYLNTNGLFGSAALAALQSDHIHNVGFHVSERKLHRAGELTQIFENAKALIAAGVDVFFRHTLWRHGYDDVEWLLNTNAELGVRHLNLALAFPGKTATNRHLPMLGADSGSEALPGEALQDVKPVYLKALDLAARLGIRVRASKPVPLCLFTPREFARIQRHHEPASICSVHARGGVHNLVVNPDLRVYPCVGLPLAGPRLTDTADYGPHQAHCQQEIRRALKVVQSGCAACVLRSLGVCQASCLGHCNESGASQKGRA